MLKCILIFFSLFITSCSPTKPTYSREEITKHITELCKKEFNIDVKVWHVEDTIWVYAPFEDILDKKGTNYKEDISKNVRRIFMVLGRIILSMENRPKFYCFVVSDIKNGIDIYYVWAIIDYVKFLFGYISQGEFNERQVFLPYLNTLAIDDKEGIHIKPYNIQLGEFILYLIRQSLIKTFSSNELKDYLEVKNIDVNLLNKRLIIKLNIEETKYKPNLNPFQETKKIAKKFLKIYEPQEEILEVEISDNIKTEIYTKNELLKNS